MVVRDTSRRGQKLFGARARPYQQNLVYHRDIGDRFIPKKWIPKWSDRPSEIELVMATIRRAVCSDGIVPASS